MEQLEWRPMTQTWSGRFDEIVSTQVTESVRIETDGLPIRAVAKETPELGRKRPRRPWKTFPGVSVSQEVERNFLTPWWFTRYNSLPVVPRDVWGLQWPSSKGHRSHGARGTYEPRGCDFWCISYIVHVHEQISSCKFWCFKTMAK